MTNSPESSKPKLLDQVRAVIRLQGMSYRTEQTYCDWISSFSIYHLRLIIFHWKIESAGSLTYSRPLPPEAVGTDLLTGT